MADIVLTLPDRLVTKRQLREVIQEVETIIEQAVQGSIRKKETGADFGVNKPSQMLGELLVLHSLHLNVDSLQQMKHILEDIEKKAVVLRVVLSAEASSDIRARIVRWFRQSMEVPVLMRFGIQPGIAGGCLVYTQNHRYDFSLRSHIEDSKISIRQALDQVA